MNPELSPVSPLFTSHLEALRSAARVGPIVDLACGRGRHALAAAAMGLPVIALDRNGAFLRALAPPPGHALARVRCDLEAGYGLPLAPNSCGAILVFRFLYRPLCDAIAGALAPGGLLLYETFTLEQRTLGTGPRNPDFLLAAGELPNLFPELSVLSHTEGFNYALPRPGSTEHGGEDEAPSSATARLAARRPLSTDS